MEQEAERLGDSTVIQTLFPADLSTRARANSVVKGWPSICKALGFIACNTHTHRNRSWRGHSGSSWFQNRPCANQWVTLGNWSPVSHFPQCYRQLPPKKVGMRIKGVDMVGYLVSAEGMVVSSPWLEQELGLQLKLTLFPSPPGAPSMWLSSWGVDVSPPAPYTLLDSQIAMLSILKTHE